MTAPRGQVSSAEAFREAFAVSRETAERLGAYESLLKTWQRTINLVSPATLDEIWSRHFADSAQLLDLALGQIGGSSAAGVLESPPPGLPHKGGGKGSQNPDAEEENPQNWLDLGSGGGFPGLVLAVLLAERVPTARMTLVESDSRKAAFLREVARKIGVAVEICVERSEKFATQAKSRICDAITARALAPLPKLLGLVVPFFSPQTVALFPKGREVAIELEEARKRFDFDSQLVPSLTDSESRIVIVRNLALKTEG